MPEARVREGKRYRYFRETGTRTRKTRHGTVKKPIGEWVYAEEGEVIEVTSNALQGARDVLEPLGVVEPIGEQDEPYSDTESVLDGLWRAVCTAVSEIDDPELLLALREAEAGNRARGSVLDAIDSALDECDDEENANGDD